MKKPLSYNLTKDNHDAAAAAGKELGWSRSLWLDNHLSSYFNGVTTPAATLPAKPKPKPKAKPETSDDFEIVWHIYGKKGNKKTSLAKFNKLSDSKKILMANHLPAYVNSTPDKQYRKNLETYINQECWNDEVITNGQQNQARFETATDRYKRQSRELQDRENAANGNIQDSIHLRIDG